MDQQKVSDELEVQSIARLLVKYSLPAIIGMTVMSLYNIIGSVYIGHGIGAMAISGMAITFPLMNLTVAVCVLTSVGGSTLCSIELGRKNFAGAARILGNVTVLSILLGTGFAAVCLIVLDPILVVFGASSETLPYARDFMQIILLGLPVSYAMLSLNNIMRASGYPQKAMWTSMFSVAVNVVTAPIFIFWFHWGMRGAALATVIAQVAGLVWTVVHFRQKTNSVHFQPGIYALRKAIIKPMFSIGLSPFLMNTCSCLVVIVINLSLYRYGGDMAIGAYGIINRMLMLFAMIVMGLTQGMQPIVGYNFGAAKPLRVRQTLVYGVLCGLGVTLTGFLCFEFLPRPLARMFTDSPELLALAVTGLRLSGALFFLVGGQIVIAAFFQSIGMASLAIFLALTRQLLFLIPGLIFLPMLFGLNGVWLSIPVADGLSVLLSIFVLWRSWTHQVNPCGGFGDVGDCLPPDDFESGI